MGFGLFIQCNILLKRHFFDRLRVDVLGSRFFCFKMKFSVFGEICTLLRRIRLRLALLLTLTKIGLCIRLDYA